MSRKTSSKNGANGHGKPKAKKPSGRASRTELAAMRAYLEATGGPVPDERVQAVLNEWKTAAKTAGA